MKGKKKSRLQQAQDKTQEAINKTNKAIEELGEHTSGLYDYLTNIQELFDKIRNVPSDKRLQYEELKEIRLEWKQQAKTIEKEYQNATVKNAGAGAAGASLGVAVVTMGPTVAMGVATTFGVASTGTAISTLSGAASTNAALAWLGGGALATGGGGMAAGEAFLALTGPLGWTIAGVSLVVSGLLFWKGSNNKRQLENVFTAISQRDVKSYELAIVELKERIKRMIHERNMLQVAIDDIQTFGLDYDLMTEKQQYSLGSYVNLMLSSTQLLINPIRGLMPKFLNEDFDKFVAWKGRNVDKATCDEFKLSIIELANLFYKIDVDKHSKKLLWKAFRNSEEILKAMNLPKKQFKMAIMDAVFEALDFKYHN